MTLSELHGILTENGIYVSDNNDFDLCMVDGRPITNIAVSERDGTIYLGDADEDEEGFQRAVINL